MKSLEIILKESLLENNNNYDNLSDVNFTNVNICIGRFQPFTNGHLLCVDLAKKQLNIPTVLCIINTKNIDEKHPFLTTEYNNMYMDIMTDNKNIIDILYINTANIVVINKECFLKGYKPISWTCGTDRVKDYQRMVNNYAPDIQILEVKRSDEDISATKVRKAIVDDDINTFKKLTPKSIHKYYKKMKDSLINL